MSSLQFGTYVFPKTFYVATDPTTRTGKPTPSPRMHGGRFLTAYAAPKTVSVKGGFTVPWNTLSPLLDALKAALATGPANLQVDSRYYRSMQCVKYNEAYEPTGRNRVAAMEIEFEGPDPFAYSLTANSNTWTAPATNGTQTITTNGNAPCAPVFAFTVGGSGAQTIAWTLTNGATGESMTLSGSATGGDVITVDCLNRTVTIAGVDNMNLFDGVFPSLAVGANTLTITITTGSIAQIATSWNDRWW